METLRLLLPYMGQPDIEPIKALIPRILMTWEVYRDTLHFLNHSRERGTEFSWVGKVETVQPLQYSITELAVLPHNSTAAKTVLDALAIGKLANQWIKKAGGRYNPLKFWGHTHKASVEPSSQDYKQMELLICGELTPSFFIRGIFALSPELQSPPCSNPYSPGQTRQHFKTDYHSACLAEFTLFDYQKGIQIRNVPWEIVDRPSRKRGLLERAGLVPVKPDLKKQKQRTTPPIKKSKKTTTKKTGKKSKISQRKK